MSVAITAIPFEPWCVDYHKLMAATAQAAQAVRKSASVFQMAVDLWAVDRKFKALLNDLSSVTTLPGDELEKVTCKLEELHSKIVSVIDLLGRRGYTNRTITAGSIRSIQKKTEELGEFIEGFRLAMNAQFQSDLTESWEEYRRDYDDHLAAK